MDLTFSTEERAFEQEVRDFIAQNLSPEIKRATALTPSVFSDPEIGMAWQRALHKKGWAAPGWPVEHGGPDWSAAQRWIFEAECARAGTPNVNVMGVKMVGPVIIGFGSPNRRIIICRASCRARITGARAIPNPAPARISPR